MDAASIDQSVSSSESGGGFLRWLGWSFFFFSLLTVFTLVKIPQSKIQGWIVGTLNQQLAPAGIQISAEEGRIALGLGLSYEMSGVRLTKVSNQKSLKFSRLEVAPSILVPLLQGKVGGRFRLEEGSGSISGQVLVKGEDLEVNVTIEGMNLGRMGILPFAADVEGTADVRGSVELIGNPAQVATLSGKIDLAVAKLTVDAQKIAGFDIPRTSISDGTVILNIGSGKATVTSLRLGKAGGADDLFGTITGDVKLNRVMESSELNLKVKFGFSDRYRQEKTISLVDSLMGGFKTPDGTFSMNFQGPAYGAAPLPGGQ
jgi:type II secretion system protein N